ncbi:hypothetical protein Kisp01_37390 [Kineosporia sp. NBRC 101677]|nr:hypothetical protein Kisp01_37390 [Kineosporia sp. NBRC 101677]
MNINVSISAAPPSRNEPTRVPLPYPPLRQSDIDMITAATGMEFKWPPAHGELFPGVATDLASARWRAMLENAPWEA